MNRAERGSIYGRRRLKDHGPTDRLNDEIYLSDRLNDEIGRLAA